jgi:hypothetical protein
MLVKEINRPLQVGYTIKHTYVAWQGVYALIFNPRKEVEESLEYSYLSSAIAPQNRYPAGSAFLYRSRAENISSVFIGESDGSMLQVRRIDAMVGYLLAEPI